MLLEKNLPTQWELKKKIEQGLIDEKPLNPVETEEKNQRLMTEAYKIRPRKLIQVWDLKYFDEGQLEVTCNYVQSCAVTYSHV